MFNIQANNYAQNTKITLDLNSVTIEKALIEIESLTDFKFFFSREDIDINKIVSIKAEKEKVKNILENILLISYCDDFHIKSISHSIIRTSHYMKIRH